jgi:hypothetical protein
VSLLLLTAGAQLAGPPDLFANALGYFDALTGSATAQNDPADTEGNIVGYFAPLYGTSDAELFPFEIDREFIPGGEGRQAFQPRFRRPVEPITARASAELVQLQGHARAHTTPEVAHAGVVFAKPTPKLRPPEEEREFRILARSRGKLAPLSAQATGHSRVLAAAAVPFEPLQGWSRVEVSWPDDTAELVAIMLMLDQEAA